MRSFYQKAKRPCRNKKSGNLLLRSGLVVGFSGLLSAAIAWVLNVSWEPVFVAVLAAVFYTAERLRLLND